MVVRWVCTVGVYGTEETIRCGTKLMDQHLESKLLHDWREAQIVPSINQVGTRDRKWTRPPDGWIKFNVDATGAQNGHIGVGCVIRNS